MTTFRSPVVMAIGLILAALLGVPFALRDRTAAPPAGPDTLIIITPHNEQIRAEFERAFHAWRLRTKGRPAHIDWRRLGGTTETRRLLESMYLKAVRSGEIAPDGACAPGTMPYDLLFGGGSFEHNKVKDGVPGPAPGPGGKPVNVPISAPFSFDRATIDGWFGENRVGSERLYDPDLHWFGAALSGFGVAYNRDALRELGLEEPKRWRDLADPRYIGRLSLADPRQSGSVATAYDAILTRLGWDEGWRTLRAMCANARSFNASSSKAVIDVASGDSAAAVCIDFYGRYESQALREPGQGADQSRLGYVDPPGEVYIDPDPISLLRGAPHPELAHEFVEFALSVEGQALWQFSAVGEDAPPESLGPRVYELRRMPVRRAMYVAPHFERFVDKVNPFEIATDAKPGAWRSLIGPIFGACAIDIHEEQVRAWEVIGRLRDSGDESLVFELERRFFAFPEHPLPDGERIPFSEANAALIARDWRAPRRAPELRIHYSEWFRRNYRSITERARDGAHASGL